jgi:hypothetical protein
LNCERIGGQYYWLQGNQTNFRPMGGRPCEDWKTTQQINTNGLRFLATR